MGCDWYNFRCMFVTGHILRMFKTNKLINSKLIKVLLNNNDDVYNDDHSDDHSDYDIYGDNHSNDKQYDYIYMTSIPMYNGIYAIGPYTIEEHYSDFVIDDVINSTNKLPDEYLPYVNDKYIGEKRILTTSC